MCFIRRLNIAKQTISELEDEEDGNSQTKTETELLNVEKKSKRGTIAIGHGCNSLKVRISGKER